MENNIEEWKKKQSKQRNWAYDEIDKMVEKIKKDDNLFRKYLDKQSIFPKYSVGNNLLLLSQFPNAREFRDWNGWKKLNVTVNKNEKPIIIIEPNRSNKGNGKIYYNPKEMYDISQTDSINKKEEIYSIKDMLKALISDCPANIEVVYDIPFNEHLSAMYNRENDTLYIKRGDNSENLIISLSFAIADMETKKEKDTDLKDFENLTLSYLICRKFGINVSNYTELKIPKEYVSNMNNKEIRKELENIRHHYEKILLRVNEELDKIKMEKNEKEEKEELNKNKTERW